MFALNTYSYIHTTTAAACLRAWSGRGVHCFEVMVYPGHFWPQDLTDSDRQSFRRFLEENGITLCSLNMPNVDLNIASADPLMRDYSLGHLVRVIQLASDVGAPGVVIGPGKPNPLSPAPRDQLLGWYRGAMDRLVEEANAAQVRLLLENMPFAFLPMARDIADVAADYPRDSVGLVYDIANAVFVGENLSEGFNKVSDRLALVHLSDTKHDTYQHAPVGTGAVDFELAFSAAERAGYRGPSVMEIITDTPDATIADSMSKLTRFGWSAAQRH